MTRITLADSRWSQHSSIRLPFGPRQSVDPSSPEQKGFMHGVSFAFQPLGECACGIPGQAQTDLHPPQPFLSENQLTSRLRIHDPGLPFVVRDHRLEGTGWHRPLHALQCHPTRERDTLELKERGRLP